MSKKDAERARTIAAIISLVCAIVMIAMGIIAWHAISTAEMPDETRTAKVVGVCGQTELETADGNIWYTNLTEQQAHKVTEIMFNTRGTEDVTDDVIISYKVK